MTFTIGRASFTNAPSAIRHNGDRVDIDIDILPASLVEAKVLRQRVLGLDGNDDEPVVPLTWSDDADYDGFYRVLGVDVEPVQAYLTNRLMRARLSLERVGRGYAAPTHEVYAVAAVSTNLTINDTGSNLIADVIAIAAVPNTATVLDRVSGSLGRTAADGSTLNYYMLNGANPGPVLAFTAWGVSLEQAPADFYDAACTVEVQISGSWYTVIGDQLPATTTVRVSNGLVRFTVESTGELTVDNYDGAAWRSKGYDLTYDSGSGTISGPTQVVVNRNGVDQCSVTWNCPTSDGYAARLSANIRMGVPLVDLGISTNSAETWKVTRATTEAGTALVDSASATYGIRATSNDANGDRFVIVSRDTATADTTNGGLTLAATGAPVSTTFPGATTVNVGIGLEVNGSSATTYNDADALGMQYQIAFALQRSTT